MSDRRTFLKRAALASATAALSSCRASAQGAPATVRTRRHARAHDRLRGQRRPARRSRSSCSTAFPTTSARSTAWCRRWSKAGLSRAGAVPARLRADALSRRGRAAHGASRRQSARTSSTSPTRCSCRGSPSPATTGAAARPRLRRRCIRDRVRATVLIGGYTIQNTIAPSQPGSPEAEQRVWYQWYFNTERGPRRAAGQSARDLPLPVADVVAELALHRRRIQPHGAVIRQPRLRRRRDSLVPAPHRQRTR